MTADEHEAQEIVADGIINCGVQIYRSYLLLDLEFATEFLVLAFQPRVAAPEIDGTMLRRGHEPGARFIRDARLRPLLERSDERVLGEILGQPDIAHNPRQPSDELGGLDPVACVNRTMCIGSGPC